MAKLTISLAQMRIALGDTRKNMAVAERLIADAASRKTTLMVFPELFSSGYDLANAKDLAHELNKGVFAQLSTWATQHKIVITGSVLEKRGVTISNSAPLFAPNGKMIGVYRKLHLFRLMQEDQYLQEGASPLSLDLPWGVTGLAICYDLRFPELFRRYTLKDGAKMMIIPAEWPLERIEHWRALLIARAIENQCYIVACNAAGETGDTVFGGHSMIVDPWGKIVMEAGDEPQLLTVEIEMDRIKEVRDKMSVLTDVREDVYN